MEPPRSSSRLAGLLVAAALAGAGAAPAAALTTSDPTPCAPVELVAARGTFEPGPLGVVVGDPLAKALRAKFGQGRVTVRAVDYPASIGAGSLAAGNAALTRHLKAQARKCPRQRFVLSGYSQGALVVSSSIGVASFADAQPAYAVLPKAVAARVAAVLLFGNPLRRSGANSTGEYASRTRDRCYDGDPACGPGDFGDNDQHIKYILGDSAKSADFAEHQLRRACRKAAAARTAHCRALLAQTR